MGWIVCTPKKKKKAEDHRNNVVYTDPLPHLSDDKGVKQKKTEVPSQKISYRCYVSLLHFTPRLQRLSPVRSFISTGFGFPLIESVKPSRLLAKPCHRIRQSLFKRDPGTPTQLRTDLFRAQ